MLRQQCQKFSQNYVLDLCAIPFVSFTIVYESEKRCLGERLLSGYQFNSIRLVRSSSSNHNVATVVVAVWMHRTNLIRFMDGRLKEKEQHWPHNLRPHVYKILHINDVIVHALNPYRWRLAIFQAYVQTAHAISLCVRICETHRQRLQNEMEWCPAEPSWLSMWVSECCNCLTTMTTKTATNIGGEDNFSTRYAIILAIYVNIDRKQTDKQAGK